MQATSSGLWLLCNVNASEKRRRNERGMAGEGRGKRSQNNKSLRLLRLETEPWSLYVERDCYRLRNIEITGETVAKYLAEVAKTEKDNIQATKRNNIEKTSNAEIKAIDVHANELAGKILLAMRAEYFTSGHLAEVVRRLKADRQRNRRRPAVARPGDAFVIRRDIKNVKERISKRTVYNNGF
ncbi:hypothetical protein EVAR_56127_1 [Eumeta japonica]|uniref:Uncharacterized protein n=1 Tax=Eumeta variegata TaxID=151549 RepID=A0A4C1Z4P9_EUMVA|nr:hypothetical protein EVAR_56127_1 [Eumeta japonica]